MISVRTGIIDPLLEPISIWVSERYGTGIKRKRNCAESSLTVDRKRPDLIWLVEGTLLFKGEDKTIVSAMDDALQDLLSKMKHWSSNYHGEVRTLSSVIALYDRTAKCCFDSLSFGFWCIECWL